LVGELQLFCAGLIDDDVVILISGKFLSIICDLMQGALNCVQDWSGEIGLNVNTAKTSLVLFTKRRNLEGFFASRHGTDTEQSGKILELF
jgi:hypothetical protein